MENYNSNLQGMGDNGVSCNYTHATPQQFCNKICSESDEDSHATPPLFPRRRICSDCSDDDTHSTPPLYPRSRLSSDSSDDSYATPKHQEIRRKRFVQSSPRGVMDFEQYSQCSQTSSERSQNSITTPLPFLRGNLMTCHQREDPSEYYEFLDILGEGSMGSVYLGKKRLKVIGGSARPSFVKRKQEAKTWKFLQSCFFFCPFATNSRLLSRDLLQVVSDNECMPQEACTEVPPKGSPRSRLISDGHRDLVYALKTINLDRVSTSDFMKELENEVNILKELDHPNIVRAIETFKNPNQLFIVLELCNGGDLYSRDPYTEVEAGRIVKAVLGAVAYMHSRRIIHRDIKFENIMFTSNDTHADVKLIDFGLSKKYAEGSFLHDTVGTVYTMAPELLRGKYTSSVDIWSTGVVAYMLLSSCMPFFGKDRNSIIRKIMKGKYGFANYRWKFVSGDAKKFVSSLLRNDAKRRPTAEQALTNPWLNRVVSQPKDFLIHFMDDAQASIQSFAEYGTLKKLALMIVAYKSTSKEIGCLRQIFDKFDTSRTGEITLPIFKQALKDYRYSGEELDKMFTGMDIDGNGIVCYREFLAATFEAHGSIDEERLAEAFDRLDCDDSGYICVDDLGKLLGDDVPSTFLETVIDTVDADHDRKVSYEKFLSMWDDTEDEKRVANQKQVRQRRLPRVDSKQSVGSFTSDTGTMSSIGGGSDDELAGSLSGSGGQARADELRNTQMEAKRFPAPAWSRQMDQAISNYDVFSPKSFLPDMPPFHSAAVPGSHHWENMRRRVHYNPGQMYWHPVPSLPYSQNHQRNVHMQQQQMLQNSELQRQQYLASVYMQYQMCSQFTSPAYSNQHNMSPWPYVYSNKQSGPAETQ